MEWRLYKVASCWTIIDIYQWLAGHINTRKLRWYLGGIYFRMNFQPYDYIKNKRLPVPYIIFSASFHYREKQQLICDYLLCGWRIGRHTGWRRTNNAQFPLQAGSQRHNLESLYNIEVTRICIFSWFFVQSISFGQAYTTVLLSNTFHSILHAKKNIPSLPGTRLNSDKPVAKTGGGKKKKISKQNRTTEKEHQSNFQVYNLCSFLKN
jgi:hypothetical protein